MAYHRKERLDDVNMVSVVDPGGELCHSFGDTVELVTFPAIFFLTAKPIPVVGGVPPL